MSSVNSSLPSPQHLPFCREYCWEARWIIFCFSLFFFLSAQASRQVWRFVPSWGLAWPGLLWLVWIRMHLQPRLRPTHRCIPPRLPRPPPLRLACLQLADYFIRWWTRDHYNKYAADCEGLCGGLFYVQYYGILGLVRHAMRNWLEWMRFVQPYGWWVTELCSRSHWPSPPRSSRLNTVSYPYQPPPAAVLHRPHVPPRVRPA